MTVPKLGDLTKSGVPILAAISMMVAVGVVCIGIGKVLADYGKQQSDISKLAVEVASLQAVIVKLSPADRWARSDQVLFCWEAERINPTWRCPALKTGYLPPDMPYELTRAQSQ